MNDILTCPRCGIALKSDTIDDPRKLVNINKCQKCGGIYFHEGELQAIEQIIDPTFVEFRHIPGQKKQQEPLVCPYCEEGNLMQKVEHPRDHHVIIDICNLCQGIWLDRGELEAIQRENWLLVLARFARWLFKGD